MLQPVRTAPLSLTAYKDCADPAMLAQAKAVAAWLHGLRVVHINATPDGGGVAEILRSLVPLLRDLGLDAQWYVLPPDDDFFAVTKQLHNWLQGQPGEIEPEHRWTYSAYLERLAVQMRHLCGPSACRFAFSVRQ